MGRGRHYSTLRRRCEQAEEWVFGNGLLTTLSFALRLQKRPRTREHSLEFNQGLRGPLRIAFASDLHAGPCTNVRLLEAAVEAIRAFQPHVVLLGGDFVTHHHRHVAILLPHLSRLAPPCGMYAVLGNHDLWTDDQAIASALESVGVRVLVNQSARLPAPFDSLWICGLDDPSTGEPDAQRTFRDAGGARLLLMHSPVGLGHVPVDEFDLALCGHTHGGQVALPGGRPIVLPPGRHNRAYPSGLFDLGGERPARMLVSKGVGCSDLPIRLFAAGEIHAITLLPAPRHSDARLVAG